MKKIIFLIFFISLGILAQDNIPKLSKYCNDFAGVLSTSEQLYLENTLKKLDDSTSNQLVIVIIKTLNNYPIESLSYEIASKNEIGTKKNNGVLILLAINDKKMRIEVGYGLEGALTDALASSIMRNEMRPYFKQGDYFNGLKSGVYSIIQAIKGEYTREDKEDNVKNIDFKFLGYIIIFILYIIFSIARKGRGGIFLGGIGGFGGGWSGGSSSFGGGGGFGGFSGGGGSFGGGGSSGSW